MPLAIDWLLRGCLVLALGGALAPLATAQAGRAQAERNAIELKQGMTLEAVQKLLGRPKRTALKHGNAPTLQWTYVFGGEYSQRVLQIVFGAKASEQWTVESWDWPGY